MKAPIPPVIQIDPQPLAEVALGDVQGARLLKAAAVGTAVAVGVAVVADDDRTSYGHISSGHYGPGH